jgi:lipoyl(octanoyl) transferase
MSNVLNWGLIDYKECEAKQLALLEEIHQSQSPGFLVLCSHPEVVTLGKSSQANEDLFDWSGPVYEVNRGGRATYHGPEQIVIYCLVNLKLTGKDRKTKDIPDLLRGIEKACITTLAIYGIKADGKTDSHSDLNDTGVWVAGKKIMSLGVAIRHWISYHGLALNYENNPGAFRGIRPCGFSRNEMTSLENILNPLPEKDLIQKQLAHSLQQILF